MSDTTKQMTPEEKLLALIQQDKRHADGAVPQNNVQKPSEAPSAAPVVGPVVPVAPVPAPGSGGLGSAKPAPAPQAVAPVPALPPVQAAVNPPGPAEKKLKLAEVQESVPTKPVPATPVPEAPRPVPAPVQEPVKTPTVDVAGGASFVSLSSSRGVPLVLLNRILGAVVLLLIALVCFRMGAIRPGIAEALEQQVSGAGNLPIRTTRVSEDAIPPVETYLEKTSQRNIFAPKLASKDGGSAPIEAAGSPKDLKLVAVSMDSSAASESMAIIKNKADSKTYFVKSGQTVGSTDYVLDKVFSDHVVIKLRKQEFELK